MLFVVIRLFCRMRQCLTSFCFVSLTYSHGSLNRLGRFVIFFILLDISALFCRFGSVNKWKTVDGRTNMIFSSVIVFISTEENKNFAHCVPHHCYDSKYRSIVMDELIDTLYINGMRKLLFFLFSGIQWFQHVRLTSKCCWYFMIPRLASSNRFSIYSNLMSAKITFATNGCRYRKS